MRLGISLSLTQQLGGFSPASLFSGGQQGAWYDPSDVNTLFQDSAGTTPVTAVGQPVGLILDKSGRGNHASQSTPGSRPLYQVDGTGRPYLSFDGSDDWFITPIVTPGIDKVQMFSGLRKLSDTPAGIFVELSAASPSNAGSFVFQAPSSGASYYWTSRGSVNPAVSGIGSIPAPVTNVFTGLASISNPFITARVNGVQRLTSSASQGTGNYLNYPIYIGRRGGATNAFNGHLYGLVLRFGENLSTSTISTMESWMNIRTGAY